MNQTGGKSQILLNTTQWKVNLPCLTNYAISFMYRKEDILHQVFVSFGTRYRGMISLKLRSFYSLRNILMEKIPLDTRISRTQHFPNTLTQKNSPSPPAIKLRIRFLSSQWSQYIDQNKQRTLINIFFFSAFAFLIIDFRATQQSLSPCAVKGRRSEHSIRSPNRTDKFCV